MKTRFTLLLSLLLTSLPLFTAKGEVKLPRFICDGMVLQRNTNARVWGKANPSESVTVQFLSKKYNAVADSNGDWMVSIPTTSQKKGGGPYVMTINGKTLNDIYIGDVWLCSGQSNMDLHTARLEDLYKDEFASYRNPAIHLMQTARTPAIDGPQDDVQAGGFYPWQSLSPQNVGHWSGMSYFYAKEMYERTGVPQGIINCSMGGSDIVSWISTEELEKVAPRYVKELKSLRLPGYQDCCNRINHAIGEVYNQLLQEDPGLKEGWMAEKYDDSSWKPVNQNVEMLYSVDGRPWCGTLWLRKTFYVTNEQLERDSLLRLGCLVDADVTYVNGVKVGETTYQYPPRKYKLPAGLLHEGRNNITICLRTNGNGGKFVPEKPYVLYFTNESTENIETGMWKMKPGLALPHQPSAHGASNATASSLYDNTIYPLRNYGIAGILWCQGETNAGRPEEYAKLLPVMINDWRRHFGNVPTVIFGLANFMERHDDPAYEGGWAKIRDVQYRASKQVPNCGFVNMIDLGEWNDIHPLKKKDAAHRAALQMQRLYLGSTAACQGPEVSSVTYQNGQARIRFVSGTAEKLEIRTPKIHSLANPLLTGCGFSVAGPDGVWYWANAKVEGNELIVWNDRVRNPCAVRCAWDDDPIVTVFNSIDLPAIPFERH